MKNYASNGSGRDSYVQISNGGFTSSYKPAGAFRTNSSLGVSPVKINPLHIAQGGGLGSPNKRGHLYADGKGRDNWMASYDGGFAQKYNGYNGVNDAFVGNLRKNTNVPSVFSPRKSVLKTQRDFFVDG